MPKIIRVLADENRESIFFQVAEDTYIGFSYESIEDSENPVGIIELIADGFIYSTSVEVDERLGDNQIDVTDEFIS